MGYIVLNCRDLEHRTKAVKRLEAAGYEFVEEPIDEQLQIYNPYGRYNGQLGFDCVDATSNKHTKIKTYIAALDAHKQTN